jgi:hypothetical protein
MIFKQNHFALLVFETMDSFHVFQYGMLNFVCQLRW